MMVINRVTIADGGHVNIKPISQQQSREIFGDEQKHAQALKEKQAKEAADEKAFLANNPEFTISYTKTLGRRSTKQEESYNAGQLLEIFIRKLPKATEQAQESMNRIKQEVNQSVPALKYKQWDFSLNQDSSIKIIGNELTQDEKSSLKDILDRSDFIENLKTIKGLMLDSLMHDRGPDLYSKGFGKYDLNEQNFSNIMRFKEYLDNSKDPKETVTGAFISQLQERAKAVYDFKVRIYV